MNQFALRFNEACVANCCAVREWDSNGTVFGFNEDPSLGKAHQAGEFGHNDFYPVSIAAAQMNVAFLWTYPALLS